MRCPGSKGKVREWKDNKRFVACAECGADVTDPNDWQAEWSGGAPPIHDYPTEAVR